MHDVRAGFERNARKVQTKLLAHAQVHLVVHQPQRDLGDLGGEFLYFYAVELIDIQSDELVHVQVLLATLVAGAQHFQFEQAQLAVADDEEVAAAAGGVEKRQLA